VRTGIKWKVDLVLFHLFTPRRQCNIHVNSKITLRKKLHFCQNPILLNYLFRYLSHLVNLFYIFTKGQLFVVLKCFIYFYLFYSLWFICCFFLYLLLTCLTYLHSFIFAIRVKFLLSTFANCVLCPTSLTLSYILLH